VTVSVGDSNVFGPSDRSLHTVPESEGSVTSTVAIDSECPANVGIVGDTVASPTPVCQQCA